MKPISAFLFFPVMAIGILTSQVQAQGYDRNGDGVITRYEWQGNDQSFRIQDSNMDGVLSGNEIRANAYPQGAYPGQYPNSNGTYLGQNYNRSQTQFNSLDANHNGSISTNEWRYDVDTFYRLDDDSNGQLTRAEYFDVTQKNTDTFSNFDRNGDSVITINEWSSGQNSFNALDRNHDGQITRAEFNDNSPSPAGPKDVVDSVFDTINQIRK